MITEREHLLPLAEEGFDLASLYFPEINASGCAKALRNFYLAPLPVGTAVQVKVYSAYVEIWHQGKCVARHERCYERHQKVLELRAFRCKLQRYRILTPSVTDHSFLGRGWIQSDQGTPSFDRGNASLNQ